jgi:hypothetical protein
MTSDRRPDEVELKTLDQQLAAADTGDVTALMQAVATYEAQLASAQEAEKTDRYRNISRTYREQLITALDDATQTEGWEFLEEFLDAYHPETGDEFPHLTTILQNVTGRYLIRTRLSDGVGKIPVEALGYFSSILDRLNGERYDYILEGMHPYGWGIGHPDHSVADDIHKHASTDIFVVHAILEHAFYADQHLATDLLERIARDDSIQEQISHPRGQMSETRSLLDAPAGAVSDFSPTIPRYWDWDEVVKDQFELDEDIEQRIRELVTEKGINDDLTSDWEIADLTL